MLFTKPKNEITFADIEVFCREFGEGVRVEYKREIKHIPKIVSSFANTHGGVFVIGAETDEQNKVKFPIQGISKKSGIEEQIQQSALTGIYPAVMPEIISVDVPDSDNVVVIIRVDESVHAPHAIQNSTRVYIRVGSITQPYELADMDRLASMFKRREDSQAITSQILNRIEEKTEAFCDADVPNLTVTAAPVFPYRPMISTEGIYGLARIPDADLRRVAGGVRLLMKGRDYEYSELNEYGIVYCRAQLFQETCRHTGKQFLDFEKFLEQIGWLIWSAKRFYDKCEYMGNIEFKVQLRQVRDKNLKNPELLRSLPREPPRPLECADSEVLASIQCLPRDLTSREQLIGIVEKLAFGLLWAFNVGRSENIKGLILGALRYNNLLPN